MRDRGRHARGPIQLATMFALIAIGISQWFAGPVQSHPINSLTDPTQRTFAGLLILSALFALAGAILPEPRAYWVELGGQVGAALALTVYTFTLKTTVPQWTTSMGSGFGMIAVGCWLRVAWLSLLIVSNFYPRLWRRVARVYVAAHVHLITVRGAIVKQWRR